MARTRHGHQIPGSPADPKPTGISVARCGGPSHCGDCAIDVHDYLKTTERGATIPPFTTHASAGVYQAKALRLLDGLIRRNLEKTDPPVDFDVYVVWFNKTLQNWKALASSTLSDGRYYEITYNGDKEETYIDTYVKVDNVCFPDTV